MKHVVDALAQSKVFGDLTYDQHDLLSRLMVERKTRPGDVLVREGDRVHPVGDALFLVLQGEIEVRLAARDKQEKGPIAVLRTGDVFGVASIVDDAPRAASCVAATHGAVACLGRRTLDALVHSNLELAAEVEFALARQLARDLRIFDRRVVLVKRGAAS